jgi:hypothetical protein
VVQRQNRHCKSGDSLRLQNRELGQASVASPLTISCCGIQRSPLSFLWLLLPLQISNAGRGTLNLDSPKNRLLFKHFSHFFRALSEPFLKFANQLVIFAFGVG